MTQLTDDCFAFGGELRCLDEALDLIRKSVKTIADTEEVDLFDAVGRVAAQTYKAKINVPPHANSAVDGFGVSFSDLNPDAETRLPVMGRIHAGGEAQKLEPKTAVRIFTGAKVPQGIDTIFMQEDVVLADETAILPTGLKQGSNLRHAGEDVAVGDRLVGEGQILRPQDTAILAAQGLSRITCRRRLKVGLISTGDELKTQIFDANQTMLVSALRRLGVEAIGLGLIEDDKEKTKEFLHKHAPDFDLLVSTGGVSTGEEDHVKSALEAVGRLNFWRIALKPGRPVAVGEIGKTVFVGLPGNPVAALVTFVAVVKPLIRALQGANDSQKPLKAMAAFNAKKKAGRLEYLRVVEEGFAQSGALEVSNHPKKGAGVLSSVSGSDGFLLLPEDVISVAVGDGPFDYFRYSDLFGGLS